MSATALKAAIWVAVHQNEYGMQVYAFEYTPTEALPVPDPRKIIERFDIDFEPNKGERFDIAAIDNPHGVMAKFSADQVGGGTGTCLSLDENDAVDDEDEDDDDWDDEDDEDDDDEEE